MKTMLKSKKGDTYIYLCVLVLFMTLLLSVILLYMGLCAQVQIQKRDIKTKLDSYVSEYARENFDAIKQGNQYLTMIDWRDFSKRAVEAIGFANTQMDIYEYPNGNCYITRPSVEVLKGNGFGITAKYTAAFRIKWNGKVFTDLKIPVTVTSYYKNK